MDSDADKKVSKEEYVSARAKTHKAYDKNKNGYIVVEEFAKSETI